MYAGIPESLRLRRSDRGICLLPGDREISAHLSRLQACFDLSVRAPFWCFCQLEIIGGVSASDIPLSKNRYKIKSVHGIGDNVRSISFDIFTGVGCVAAGSPHISPNPSPKGGDYIGFLYGVVEAEAT
jgi:hypothetical protein